MVRAKVCLLTEDKSAYWMCSLWLLAACSSSVQAFAFHVKEFYENWKQCVVIEKNEADSLFGTYFNNRAYSVAHFFLCYLLPVSVIVVSQGAVMLALRSPRRQSMRSETVTCKPKDFDFDSNLESKNCQLVTVRKLVIVTSDCDRHGDFHRRFTTLQETNTVVNEQCGGVSSFAASLTNNSNANANTIMLDVVTVQRDSQSELPLEQSSTRIMSKARALSLRTSSLMLLCYVACWTPHYFMNMTIWFYPERMKDIPFLLENALNSCAMFNCCINPLVYGFTIPSIRRVIKRWFSRLPLKILSSGRRMLHCLRVVLYEVEFSEHDS